MLKNNIKQEKTNKYYRRIKNEFLLILINIIKIIVSYEGVTKTPFFQKRKANLCHGIMVGCPQDFLCWKDSF